MKTQETWLTIHFYKGKAEVEMTINYQTKTFSVTHGSNNNNITFNGKAPDFKVHEDRLKCVAAALAFAKKELE